MNLEDILKEIGVLYIENSMLKRRLAELEAQREQPPEDQPQVVDQLVVEDDQKGK